MKKTGHNSFRVSISWARMFPNGGTGKVNPKAISFYRKLFSEMNNNGIKVFANKVTFKDVKMKRKCWVEVCFKDKKENIVYRTTVPLLLNHQQ